MQIILASQSPSRLALLATMQITPSQVIPAGIDENPKEKELPDKLAARLAKEKALFIADKKDIEGIIIAADSVVAVGRFILPKTETHDDIRQSILKLSGRRHRVYTSVIVLKKSSNAPYVIRQRTVKTIVKFKRLTQEEINFYSSLDDGLNKAGGYSITEYAGTFVEFISGSYSNVMGLPVFETRNMLTSVGVPIIAK